MSFEDPFAGDLKSITAMMADFGPSRPKAAGTTISSSMGPANTATPVPLSNPSAANLGVAPRTGRRAAQPVDTGASIGGLGAQTSQTAGPPPAFATLPTDELSWLDDPPLLRPTIKDHAAPEPTVQQPTITARPAALDNNPWDFLSEGITGAMGGAAMDTPATAPAISTAAAAAAEKKTEETATIRDLQASLLALDSELSGLEDRLTTREVKEEAELTELTTTVMEKHLELEQQDTAHDAIKADVERNTARRLDSMAQRYADDLAELVAQVRLQEGTRLQRQVQQLQNALNEASSNIEQLERQRALVVAESPYSKQGVLLALSAAENTSAAPHDTIHEVHSTAERRGSHRGSNDRSNASTLVSHLPPTSSAGSSRRSSSATPSVPEAPVSPLEVALRTAVGVLQQYYQERISSLKDNIVDYLHKETIDVAHESRTRHCLGLVQEATDRKSQFAAYIVEMTKRYLDACRDREALKQRNMQSLHSEIQADASRLRAEAAARLETLTTEVTARWQVAVQQFEATASASRDALERQAHFTDEGDRSIATAQRAQVEGRCETERSVRHRLWMTEQETLSMQLAKMRAHGDAVDSERWRGLLQTALSSSEACGLQELQKQLANLRFVAETNTEEEQRRATGAPPRWQRAAVVTAADCTEEDILRMNATEATHTIASLLREVQLRQEKLTIAWTRSRQMREVTCLRLEEAAVALVDRRHAQQSHQSAVDFARVMWERDHRANLSASLQLEMPIGLRGELLGTATHAAPADMTVVGLVELVVNQLETQKTRMAHLRSERRALLEDHTTDLSCLTEAHGVLREMTGHIEEMHTEQHRASEVLLKQQLAVYQEALRAQAAVEALEAQRSDLQARRECTERAMRHCQEESAEVLDGYERHRTHLQHLADEQLRLAQTHHELTVQQRLQSLLQGVVSHRHQQQVDVLNTAARPLDVSARPHTSALHDHGGFSNSHVPAPRTGVATANCTPPQERTAPSAHSSGLMRSQSSTTPKGILEDDNRIGSLPDKDHKPRKQQPETLRGLPEAVTTVPRHQSTYENVVLSPSSEPYARLDDHSPASGSSFQYHSSTFMDLVTLGDSLTMSSA